MLTRERGTSMCLNANRPSGRQLLIVLTTALMVGAFFMQPVHASMVIAPSTVVVNSNTDDGAEKNSAANDTTIKAIISYKSDPLPEGSQLLVPEDPEIVLYRAIPDETPGATELILYPIESASSIRYCFEDDNLIVEFDRAAVTAYLLDEKLNGVIDVVVQGAFTFEWVTMSESGTLVGNKDEKIVNEEGQIFVTNRLKNE